MADRGRRCASGSRSRSPSKGGTKMSKKEKKQARERRKAEGRRSRNSPDTDSSSEVAKADSSAPLQLAIPAGDQVVSVDFVNALASNINELMVSVKELHVGMKDMQKESREQRGQISAILGELQSMRSTITASNNKYKDDMNTLNKDIEAKLASLQANSAKPLPSASSSASASSSLVGPSRPPSLPSAAAAVGHRPLHRPSRLWFKGFGEILTTKALNQFTSEAVGRLPKELAKDAKSGAPGFGQVAYVDFPLTAPISTIKQHLTDLKLQHTLENGDTKNIRIANDVPIPVRYTSKILGGLWQQVKEHLSQLVDPAVPEPIQLSTSNGKLYLIRGARPLLLFDTRPDANGTLQVIPKTDHLALFKITVEVAEAWITDAVKAASRLAPQ
jgi:hypothetical protein